MTDSVHLEYVNDVHARIVCEPGILREIADSFTYFAPNYKFHPKFKSRVWDGKIRLVNTQTGLVYVGLAKRIKKFCDSRNYPFTFDYELTYDSVSEHEILDHIEKLKIPSKFEKRDYQIQSVIKCIRTGRRTLLSPTSSGKSLIIYIISSWYKKHKKLIIVPTIQLVNQMEGDFRDYGFKGKIHKSTDKLSKEDNIDAEVVITTWQSLNNGKTKMPPKWYKQFGVVFGDECFVRGSKVLTPNGYVNIEDIKIGDLVINYDEKRKIFKEDIVVDTYVNLKKSNNMNVLKLFFDNGSEISVTENHKFMTNLGWVQAKDLTEEHIIINT